MALALKVLVSTMSAPASRYSSCIFSMARGLGQAQDVVAPLQRFRVLREAGTAEIRLAEPQGLYLRPHGAVEQQDPVRR